MDLVQQALKKKEELLLKNKKYNHFEKLAHRQLVGKYIGDLVYGANDGIITTFAVVAGASGASLSHSIVLVLGFANLFADGLSMGASNFLGKKSEKDFARAQYEKESWEIDNLRELEVEEIRDIYKSKGFKEKDLDRAVEIIISDRKVWLDTMMKDELGIMLDEKDEPIKHGVATFFAFIVAGFIPLIPFLIPDLSNAFVISTIVAAVTLFVVGALRTLITTVSFIQGGIEMLLIGSAAGAVAYVVGRLIESIVS